MNTDLTQKKCVPCRGGILPMTVEQAQDLLRVISSWRLEGGKLVRDFGFKNFKEAIIFINKVGDIAEEEGHHPNIFLHSWNKVTLTLFTHKINGLHQNDFILAAKINTIRV